MIAIAAALALAPAAQARKVLNPTDQLDVTATALLIDVGDGHIHQDMTGLSATLLDAARVAVPELIDKPSHGISSAPDARTNTPDRLLDADWLAAFRPYRRSALACCIQRP